MWLEDDWDLLIPFNMGELVNGDYEYIGFHFHHFFEFSFNPTMWSKDFFVKNVYEPFAVSEESIDPEQLLINYHKQTKSEDPNHLKNINRINFNGVFKDAGRKWGEQYNLKKWNKNKTGEVLVMYKASIILSSYNNLPALELSIESLRFKQKKILKLL